MLVIFITDTFEMFPPLPTPQMPLTLSEDTQGSGFLMNLPYKGKMTALPRRNS